MPPLLPLLIFAAAYVGFLVWPAKRAWLSCAAAVLLTALGAAGQIPQQLPSWQVIPWNVLGLLTGMMVLAKLFEASRIPAIIAETMVDRSPSAMWAFFWITAIGSLFSTVLDNVTCVLLLAPIALSLARKLKLDPTRPLILIAIASNLQGTATMIGDPPSMLMAGHMKLGFNDFFFHKGRPGIFWAVELGAVAAMAVAAWTLRHYRRRIELLEREQIRSWTPAWLIGALVTILACASKVDPDFAWAAGTAALVTAGIGALWYLRIMRWGPPRDLVQAIDFTTILFLLGMFVLVAALDDAGWLKQVAAGISRAVGGSPLLAFAGIVVFAMLISAVVDNVPFLLAMLPVTDQVARQLAPAQPDTYIPLLMFGLLIGCCLGGNITPIGASANVVAIGILNKEGRHVSFGQFARIGVPFTLAAVLVGATFIWFVWS
jgi:Na+/H+ antiporter NhaD/arsenite permease-like protein